MKWIKIVDQNKDIRKSKFGEQTVFVYELLKSMAVDGVVSNPDDAMNMVAIAIDSDQLSTRRSHEEVFRGAVSKLKDSGWVETDKPRPRMRQAQYEYRPVRYTFASEGTYLEDPNFERHQPVPRSCVKLWAEYCGRTVDEATLFLELRLRRSPTGSRTEWHQFLENRRLLIEEGMLRMETTDEDLIMKSYIDRKEYPKGE